MFENVSKMILAGARYSKPKRVNHTPQINLKAGGQPHSLSREATRRIRQQERMAWKELEREKKNIIERICVEYNKEVGSDGRGIL